MRLASYLTHQMAKASTPHEKVRSWVDGVLAQAADDEIAFVQSLCSEPQDSLVAVHRTFENGEVREQFRTLRPRAGTKPARAFSFFEVEGEEEPGEAVDLIGMAERKG